MSSEEEESAIEFDRKGLENTLKSNEEVTDIFMEMVISICDENEEALKQLGDR